MNAIDDAITQVIRIIPRCRLGSSRPSSRGQGSALITPRAHGSTNGCAITAPLKDIERPDKLVVGAFVLLTMGGAAAQLTHRQTPKGSERSVNSRTVSRQRKP